MLHQRMFKPQLTVHRGIWKLSKGLTTHSWESTATSLSSSSLPTSFPQLESCSWCHPLHSAQPSQDVSLLPRVQLWLLSQRAPKPGSHTLPAHCTQTAGDYTKRKTNLQKTEEKSPGNGCVGVLLLLFPHHHFFLASLCLSILKQNSDLPIWVPNSPSSYCSIACVWYPNGHGMEAAFHSRGSQHLLSI